MSDSCCQADDRFGRHVEVHILDFLSFRYPPRSLTFGLVEGVSEAVQFVTGYPKRTASGAASGAMAVRQRRPRRGVRDPSACLGGFSLTARTWRQAPSASR